MDRLFLDANILFSAAYHRSSALRVLWELDAEVFTSDYALDEAVRNLRVTRPAALAALDELITRTTVIANIVDALPPQVELPEKDQPILAAAIAAGATFLLTGDKTHFGPLFGQNILGTTVLMPAEYLSRVDSSP